jgi:membrane-bound serine protease (ClpP class)
MFHKKFIYRHLLGNLLLLWLLPLSLPAQNTPPNIETRVFVMELKGPIDPRTNRYTELALNEATDKNADIVIIDMDTYGGAVNDADDIRTRILEYPVPVWVFINKDAASAGALISLAADSIYMANGASIGAATVVNGTGEAAPDKYQSYMRSIMRSTAESNGRDPRIAEAMVDEDLEVDGISKKGEVITFSTSEAIRHGFAEGQVNSIEDILKRNEVSNYEIIRYEVSFTEKIISFFINPFISGILILVIIGGLYFELQTPGVGFPLAAALLALVFYLVPYYLNGLAEYWEIILFFVGIALIIAEVFVIPGFGIAGISGLFLTIGSLIFIMLNNDVFDFELVAADRVLKAVLATIAGMLGSLVVIFAGGLRFANSKAFSRVALEDTQDSKQGYSANFRTESFIGRKGTAYTVLRPSGKILLEGEIYDAYTRGDYIEQGTKVIVVDDHGSSFKVKIEE